MASAGSLALAIRTAQNTGDMSESPPPHVQLIQMATGLWLSRIIFITAELNLADRLTDGPKSAADLAGPPARTNARCIG